MLRKNLPPLIVGSVAGALIVLWALVAFFSGDGINSFELQSIVIGFLVKLTLAFIGFLAIKHTFVYLVYVLRQNELKFENDLARAIFFGVVFFALSIFMALLLI